MDKKRVVSVFQVVILIIGLISISYSISEEFHLVSAASFLNTKTGIIFDHTCENCVEISPKDLTQINNAPLNQRASLLKKLTSSKSGGTPSNMPIPIYKNIYGFGEAAAAKEAGEITSTAADKMTFAQGNAIDGIVSSAAWAGSVAVVIKMGGSLFGFEEDKVNAVSYAAAGGIFTGQLLHTGMKEGGWMVKHGLIDKAVPNAGAWSLVGGLAVSAAIFFVMYKSEETETKIYTCELWQPPVGGSNCEKCNKKGSLPCSEYQCKSLGQSCELLNKGTDEEQCDLVRELEGELEKEGISVWFEEIGFDENKEITNFIYGVQDKNTDEKLYFRCVVNEEYNADVEKLKEELGVEGGVFLFFNEEDF